MSATLTLLDLAGNVGLLLWGTHMVTTGVLRGYGSSFRRWLERNLSTRTDAFLAGLVVTTLLQSSTATGLLATSLTAGGIMALSTGLCVMLGANVGTTVVVQALSFNIGAVAPILVLAGLLVFQRAQNSKVKNFGRIAIGLGLMLLALNLLIHTTEPIEDAPALRTVISILVQQPVLAAMMATLVTWLCHSSVAVVLFVVSLVKSGTLSPVSALALVIGANLGSTIPPFLEASTGSARRLPLGNILVRAVGCLTALPLIPEIAAQLARVEPDPTRIVVNFHTAFNLVLALIFIWPSDRLAQILSTILPDPAPAADPAVPRYLDPNLVETSSVALANAAREALRMGEMVQVMLKGVLEVFRTSDRARAREISHMDSVVDRLGFAVQRYLAGIGGEEVSEEDSLRNQEIFTFTINMDYMGDVVANMMTEFAARKIKQGQSFAHEEFEAISTMHTEVLESLKLGVALLISGDHQTARQLLERKQVIWQIENHETERYFQSLGGTSAPKAQDDFYMRMLRDLRRIHSYIAALAYPVLDRPGRMLERVVDMPAVESPKTEAQKTIPGTG